MTDTGGLINGRVLFLALIILLLPVSASAKDVHSAPVGTIKILTLDDRPPNSLMLKQLGAIAGIYPEIHYGWEPEISTATFDLVSLNAAVAESLVRSRTALAWEIEPPMLAESALVHFAFPRAQPTVTDNASMKAYGRVLALLTKADSQRKVIGFLEGRIESTGIDSLDEYSSRMSGWIEFLDRCEIDPDRLLITLDDNRPGPLADWLKLRLMEYSHHVMDGTDEGMMLLLARYLRENQPESPTTAGLIWTNAEDLTSIAPLESGFVFENILSELRWLKLRTTSRLDMVDSWRPVLWINGMGAGDSRRDYFILKTTRETIGERRVIVADTAELNRADPVLLREWRDGGVPENLVGYLGWNTSSNTLGSAMALWVAVDYGYTTRPDPTTVESAVDLFLWSRILDDWLYQTRIRTDIQDEYKSTGVNIWDLTDDEASRAAEEIAFDLRRLWNEYGEDFAIPLRILDTFDSTHFTVELPWNRFFEIRLVPTDKRGWIPVISEDTSRND